MRISDWSSDVCSSDLTKKGVGRFIQGKCAGPSAGASLPHFRSCRSAAPGASILLFGGVLELALGHAGDEDVARAGEAGGGKGVAADTDLDRPDFDTAAPRLPQFLDIADHPHPRVV